VSEPTPPGPPPTWTPGSSPEPPPSGPSRGRTVFLVGLALAAALSVIGIAVLLPRVVDELTDDGVTSPSIGEPTMDDVLVVGDLSTEHRDDEDVEYPETPPLGGPHDGQWLACGAYDEPVRDENAVHDLEHGSVWITYDPDALTEAEVAALEEKLPANGILSPFPELPAPVVVTVWGAQLRLTGADDARLAQFLEEYGDGSTAPEPFASCEGGLTDPQGGQPGVSV
jgi:Protein of unknown function (DUF3105)